MTKWVVTNVIKFKLEDDKRFNTPGNSRIVCGIFDRRRDAKNKIKELLTCPLFSPELKYLKKMNDNKFVINDPGYLKAEFEIFEHDFGEGDKSNGR